MFLPEFHADLSLYKEMRVLFTRYDKTCTFFAAILSKLRPFGPGRKNFNT